MSWMKDISKAIAYIEENITEDLSIDDIAGQVHFSPFYFQKGFSILCGFSVSEYIRNRRLSLAGRDLQRGDAKVIDIALKYCYDSPDSFAKAFTRFHGITPTAVKNGEGTLKNFMPLKLQLTMKGGFEMECKIITKAAFTVIGCSKLIPYDEGYIECPKFWKEHYENGGSKYVCGMYGISFDENADRNAVGKVGGSDKDSSFKYMIADDYVPSKEIPEGFETITIAEHTWAVFPCRGPMPDALQAVNTRIYAEWLPENSDYDIAAGYNIEFYTPASDYPKGTADESYYCEIWMPVKAK